MIEFKITENNKPITENHEIYNEFIQLYNNTEIPVNKIKQKLQLTPRKYAQLRNKALQENKIKDRCKKPYNKRKTHKKKETKKTKYYTNITGTKKYQIRKTINNKTTSYGVYKDLNTTIKIIKKLQENNWDKKQLQKIKKEVQKTE